VLIRYARAEIEAHGVRIKPGDLVLLNIQSANYEEAVFRDPAQFDIYRPRNPHLAFGHGRYHCLGASLARIELEVVIPTAFRRFPGLRLAIPLEELRQRDELFTGGLQALPVTW